MHSTTPSLTSKGSRLKLAELTSGIGAIVLGLGLGVVAGRLLAGIGLPLLISGLLLHGWGMYDKHRLESGAVPQPWWATALYWICWALLAGLAAYLLLTLGRS
jgi:Mn2+/Fe2+ NRAMP family transporter